MHTDEAPFNANAHPSPDRIYLCVDEKHFEQLVSELQYLRLVLAQQALAVVRIGHDVRNHLQTIVTTLDLATWELDARSRDRWMALAKEQLGLACRRLGSIADEAPCSGDAPPAAMETFAVSSVMDRVHKRWCAVAEAQHMPLDLIRCDAIVTSNAHMLDSILDNLVGNALKHAGVGCVQLSCKVYYGYAWVSVRDEGPGLPPHVIESSQDIESQPARENGGAGLGLGIVRRTAELLQHPINVRSVAGQGTLFTIRIPLARPGGPALYAAESHISPTRSVFWCRAGAAGRATHPDDCH
jgi:signal transduction histidine kinase